MDALFLTTEQVAEISRLSEGADSLSVEGTNLVGVVCVRVHGLAYLVSSAGNILALA